MYDFIPRPPAVVAATGTAFSGGPGATGTILTSLTAPIGETREVSFPHPVPYRTDLHVTIGGAGAEALVYA